MKDAVRSLVFILLAFGVLALYLRNVLKKTWLPIVLLSALMLVDLWPVAQRYLNNGSFQTQKKAESGLDATQANRLIKQDQELNYRVANLAGNTFNDAQTSYHHKSIGGYSGVKLRRYQDLIDFYLQGELQQGYRAIAQAQGRMTQVDPDTFKILNMLNTKYFILSGSDGNTVPVENPYRYGNAWFPNQIQWVANADEEILALPKTDLQHVAIVDQRYRDRVQGERFEPDSTASIVNTLCKPDHLQYQYNSSRDQLVVFSEVFYDKGGWDVTLDGQPVSHFRADYILRAMTVPAGKHEIDFHYTPHARVLGCKISNIASVVCIMVILLGLALGMKRQQRS